MSHKLYLSHTSYASPESACEEIYSVECHDGAVDVLEPRVAVGVDGNDDDTPSMQWPCHPHLQKITHTTGDSGSPQKMANHCRVLTGIPWDG